MKLRVATVLSTVCILFVVVRETQCARILAIVPTPSYSHQIPFRPLWLQLHKRGHEIVLITTNAIPDLNLTNFTQILVEESYPALRRLDHVRNLFDDVSCLDFMEQNLISLSNTFSRVILENAEVRKLYAANSDEKFDVVMTEVLLTPAIYAFAHRFDAPLIGLTSLAMLAYNEHVFGGFVLPSHESTWEMEASTGPNLSFWKRLKNFVSLWRLIYLIYRDIIPNQQELAEKNFGTPLPPLLEIQKNISLLFANQADAIVPARPKLANMITFTSFHVSSNPPPLPQDLKRFVDNATEGFIYFSLGSNVMGSSLPTEIRQMFIDVLAKLPYKVVWKFEKDLPDKPDNVFSGPWFSQQSILAHPNIKLFMYQGGLQSSEEAIHFTVPLIGFPVLGDQAYQARRMGALGVAKVLDLTTLTRNELDSSIREVISNKKYKEKMIELKNKVNDNPYDLENNLVWWTEYVIRHKGAPHLRSSLAGQPWYQRGDMDIVVFLTIVTFIVVSYLLRLIIKFTISFCKRWQTLPVNYTKKIS
ncbi:UDP-glucosyltransferase 2-like [Ptiloglossa arizonensis]|uniref:UDP-glucosyltransferase 2-like n=1 Tax=Ptiloglossa arizonensis TaxID=3350558 RepID=UPI003F9EDC32